MSMRETRIVAALATLCLNHLGAPATGVPVGAGRHLGSMELFHYNTKSLSV